MPSKAIHPPRARCKVEGWHDCKVYKVLERGAPPQRGKPPTRSQQRIKSKGKPRHKVSGKPDEQFRAWVRGLPCCISGRLNGEVFGPPLSPKYKDDDFEIRRKAHVIVAHVKSRGAGGEDHGNIVPMEWLVHEEQHRIGIRSFEKKYGIDLKQIAAELYARYTALSRQDPNGGVK